MSPFVIKILGTLVSALATGLTANGDLPKEIPPVLVYTVSTFVLGWLHARQPGTSKK